MTGLHESSQVQQKKERKGLFWRFRQAREGLPAIRLPGTGASGTCASKLHEGVARPDVRVAARWDMHVVSAHMSCASNHPALHARMKLHLFLQATSFPSPTSYQHHLLRHGGVLVDRSSTTTVGCSKQLSESAAAEIRGADGGGDEIREMIERAEDRGFEEPLELEGTQDEFSKCINSKIRYTRALLLELTEVEVCRRLPSDFDLLILRQLDEESNATVEHKSIFGKPFDHEPSLTTTWNLAFPGERQDNHLYTQSKDSHSQQNCSFERRDMCQLLPQKSEKDAGVLHCEIKKTDSFQLSKTENPYRPPHLSKKMPQPLATFYEPGVESSKESDQKGSADDITGHANSGYGFVLAVAEESPKVSLGTNVAFRRNNEGNEVTESSEPLDECEDFWRENEGNAVIGANTIIKGLKEDNQPTFDDFWAEILEIIHLQLEPNISATNRNNHADSDVEIHFPDEESLTSVDPLQNLNYLNLDDSNAVPNSEAEIILPDEDCLISIHDMMAFDSSMPTVNSGSLGADKVTSSIAVDNRKKSKSANFTKPNDRSKRLHRIAQPPPNLSWLATHGQLHSPLPHSLTSMDIFGPAFPFFMTPNLTPYIRCLDCFTQSDIHLPFCPEATLPNTNTNDSVSQYSLLHQPNIFLQQPNHLLFDTTCVDPTNLLAVYDFDAMQFLHSTSQQAIHEGFGKSRAEKPQAIVDRKIQKLRNKEIDLVKVIWNHHGSEEETWELESELLKKYPDIAYHG
ncbi:hypothetical protein C2S53_011652 [Perilla frutescens var. hirtella]|uniref:Chromo domain-containing protein n=1 Tax=Perilla frutescens var. hirtella TaxID=608512 RepID=A0AAD4PDE5_PERFH|nr:hypothetical protein C2S53_011652 [Perilla frutescens var. hirtella]